MSDALPPNATIGIIGGGQLGRMLAVAAAQLGYRTVVLEPQADCPTAQVANDQIVAAYDDEAGLARLCDVLTMNSCIWNSAMVQVMMSLRSLTHSRRLQMVQG